MKKNFLWSRVGAIAKKEVFHIWRDPFTMALALGIPMMMLLVYGVAIDFNIRDISLSVHDSDRTQASRRLVDTFTSSHYFSVRPALSPAAALQDVIGEQARAGLIIPARFEKDLLAGRGTQAQLLLDGADNSTVGPVLGYLGGIQAISSMRIGGFSPPALYDLRTRFLFNPELNSRWFVVPGLSVVVMAILSILLTALTVAREWENGSMELLLSTPVQPLEIIIGKLAPYAGLGVLAQALAYTIARAVFHVPFVGNLLIFSLGCLLCLATYLAQGIFISVTTRNQQVAMQFSMLSGMLPSNMLSGFVFPIASMPIFFRYLTVIFPARWFMEIARDTYLKGSNILDLWLPFSMLILLCTWMITGSVRRFKKDLEL